MPISIKAFAEPRKSGWKRLEALAGRLNAAPRHPLTDAEAVELGRLYREAAADLAQAQRDYPGHPVAEYLNQIVALGHSAIYRPPTYTGRHLSAFFTTTLPRQYRALLPYTRAAALLLFLPALIAALVTALHPHLAPWLGLQEEIGYLREGALWTGVAVPQRPLFSSFVMQNNLRVIFWIFAGGVPLGLPTLYALVHNGLHLGGVLGLALHYGMALPLFDFIIGHGVLELSVVCVAGGCGLRIGWALLHPGDRNRHTALMAAARQAVVVLLGCAPFLIVAGLIEAFVSPSALPLPFKIAVGLLSGLAFHGYLLKAGTAP